jgi:hypothetical protein
MKNAITPTHLVVTIAVVRSGGRYIRQLFSFRSQPKKRTWGSGNLDRCHRSASRSIRGVRKLFASFYALFIPSFILDIVLFTPEVGRSKSDRQKFEIPPLVSHLWYHMRDCVSTETLI